MEGGVGEWGGECRTMGCGALGGGEEWGEKERGGVGRGAGQLATGVEAAAVGEQSGAVTAANVERE